MDIHTATEQAYRNGYEAGKRDAEPKWIPVTERLPEDGSAVLAYHDHSRDKRICLEIYVAGSWFDPSYHMFDEGITNWMPLPEPPTE